VSTISENGTGSSEYCLFIHPEVDELFKRLQRKDPELLRRVRVKIEQICSHPELFKPLRRPMKNRRRVQVGSFVIVYAISGKKIEILDFDHHDRIYVK
jgi:mRNA-degrading endonuclease RelE of RelBE toxin-antitoxin system